MPGVGFRHFASQKVLAVLNLLSAVLLVAVSQVKDPTVVIVVLIIQQLCYMPTWGLTSAIAMASDFTVRLASRAQSPSEGRLDARGRTRSAPR